MLSFCRSSFSLPLLLGCLSAILAHSKAGPTNTTIDDTNPAFSFVGPEWNSITPDDPCGFCSVKLQPSSTYNSTWHDGGSVGLTGSFRFEGSAVYLFGVTAEHQTAEIAFIVDNGVATNYNLNTVSQSVSHIYNSLLFSASGLSNGQHTLSWTLTTVTSPASFSSAAVHVALIDYAVVTSDIDSTSSSSNLPSSDSVNSPISNTVPSSVTSTAVQSQDSSDSTQSSSKTSIQSTNSSGILFHTALKSTPSSIASTIVAISSLGISTLTTTSSSSTPSAIIRASQSKSNTKRIILAVVGSTAGSILILCIILFARRKRYLRRYLDRQQNVTPFIPESGNGPHAIRGPEFHSEKRRTLGSIERDYSATNSKRSGTESAPSGPSVSSTTVDAPSNGTGIEQIEERIQLLEHLLLRQADQAESILPDTNAPPPY
ncbi:hypothetical protein GYMLUDRAFT_55642 [Collybiopsis luxurians FD-317 M1]|nr:hypothetical protein GYMLUDRAFT_55642 [Collybiopsis luxurians FD-317 M1]